MDQFFYPGLQKTEFRDAGQTVSRWTGTNPEPGEKGRKTARIREEKFIESRNGEGDIPTNDVGTHPFIVPPHDHLLNLLLPIRTT